MNETTLKLNADPYILMALREDISNEDITTNAIHKDREYGEADLICKQKELFAGLILSNVCFNCSMTRAM